MIPEPSRAQLFLIAKFGEAAEDVAIMARALERCPADSGWRGDKAKQAQNAVVRLVTLAEMMQRAHVFKFPLWKHGVMTRCQTRIKQKAIEVLK